MATRSSKQLQDGDYANPASLALHEFLRVAGESVFNLNTIIVGLAAVEDGKAAKPESLHISWDPKDRIAAARKARKAAIHAQMVEVVEAINQYVQSVTKLPKYSHFNDLWRENKTSMADRLGEFANLVLSTSSANQLDEESKSESAYLISGAKLLMHWRNRHVHSSSNASLKHHELKALENGEERIAEKYSALEVDRLLIDFTSGQPSLKDASSLMAMTVRLIRRLDRCLYNCKSWADVQAWLKAYELDAEIEKVSRETAPDRRSASIRKLLHTRAPQLEHLYFEFQESPKAGEQQNELGSSD
jgi:hypothetical protein